MNAESWKAMDSYLEDILCLRDPRLDAALARCEQAGLPPHGVALNQGRMLQIFARMAGARRILEIGTLGGYSAICMADALPQGGKLVSLESNLRYAEVARENIRVAGLSQVVDVVVGDAGATLDGMVASRVPPFDLIFIDADKKDNPRYMAAALALSRDGTVIVGDNIIRGGRLMDEAGRAQPDVLGTRAFLADMARDLRLTCTALQTVGAKGWDGFSLAIVSKPA
ncbi:methyltransferase [Bordetella sp. H567]|uniref:O-methyltransferase n=1 Tax=Bordetella sp. H567 TaxID=1697043 RepID=UPI00081CE2D9|nr:O-methyltransferase [Bordetella sp. H567]AOB30442.1 methyltransferase [Bordetella sp. H567]